MSDFAASVIIPTYDSDLRLKWCLEALCRQAFKDFEVVVVNDDGPVRTKALAERYHGRLAIRYIDLPGPKTDSRSGAARNTGARVSTGERLIFLDSDMVADPDFVAAHTERAERRTAYYGFRRHYPQEYVQPYHEPLNFSNLQARSLADSRLSGYAGWQNPELYLHFLSCNYSMAADVFCELGGHDERFVGWGGEDIDLGFRLCRAGYEIQPLWGIGLATHLDHPQRAAASGERPWLLDPDRPLCANGGPLVRFQESEFASCFAEAV
jgi:glycosyltransferase involved in cell wall biosynthesis